MCSLLLNAANAHKEEITEYTKGTLAALAYTLISLQVPEDFTNDRNSIMEGCVLDPAKNTPLQPSLLRVEPQLIARIFTH
jgi:hypothetical protein